MSGTRWALRAALATALCLMGAAHAHAQAPTEGYKIGVLLPLSGKHKKLGEAALEAVTLAKVAHPDVEMTLGDTRGTPEGARAELERLAADPTVVAILGPIGWKTTRAAAERAEQLGLPLISLSSQDGVEDIGPFVFRGRPSVEEQARAMAEFGVRELQIQRFAILHPDNTLGAAASEAFFEQARASGGMVTAMSSYKTGDTNFQKAVEELVAKRAHTLAGRDLRKPPKSRVRRRGQTSRVEFEAVFIPDYDGPVVLATQFMRFHDVPLSGLGDGSAIQILGISHIDGPQHAFSEGLTGGALYPEIYSPDRGGDAGADFAVAFEDAYDRPPVDLDAEIADLFAILALHTAEAGREVVGKDRRRRSMASRLIGMKALEGMTGPRWFEEDGAPGIEFEIWVVGSGGDVSPSF